MHESFLENKTFSFADLLNLLPTPSCLTNNEGLVLDSNDAFKENFNIQSQKTMNLKEILDHSHINLMPPIIKDSSPKIYWLKSINGEFKRFDIQFLQKEIENKIYLIWSFHNLEPLIKNQEFNFQNESYILKTEYGSFLCHEINNVLATIFAKISLLKRKLTNNQEFNKDDLSDFLNKLEASSLKISKQIIGFRSHLRMEQDDPQFDISLNQLMTQIFEVIKTKKPLKNNELLLPESINKKIFLRLRKIQFQECLLSLFFFTLENSLWIENANSNVRFEIEEIENSKIKMTLKGLNHAIKAEDFEKWKDPFYNIAPFNEANLLNLSLCKKIIEKSSGKLDWILNEKELIFTILMECTFN